MPRSRVRSRTSPRARARVLGYFTAVAGARGLARLGGALFVRAAGLTFERLGWVGEGEKGRERAIWAVF